MIKNDIDKGWLAGIIDGEGSVVMERTSDTKQKWRHPRIYVASNDREILEKCRQIVGAGSISKKNNTESKQSWSWTVGGGIQVLNILQEIEPYLTCPKKKRRASYLIEQYHKHTLRNGSYTEKERVAKKEFEENFFML